MAAESNERIALRLPNGKKESCHCFQMPLHYPRFSRSDYETMPEWKLNCLLKEYGLPVTGDLDQKRKFVIGAFLWPESPREKVGGVSTL
ncbi:hypothetical protein AMTRI_Chr01g130570 [Amborella trichopoda]|uniref:DUF7722 domain-containing protein n=1 Tax=Amborella trichopoda TaxID=13333 RepID=W1P9M3_AMBTC|nr:hypothetical protein AMTR_s00075p00194500 [Amborella trichopoda]